MTNLNKDQGVSIMMVTHDPYSASYCQRILFIQDGELYKEIHRGGTREEFYKEIFRCASRLRHTKSVGKEVQRHVIQTFHVRTKSKLKDYIVLLVGLVMSISIFICSKR